MIFDRGNTSKDLRRKGEERQGGWEVVKGNSTIKRSRGVTLYSEVLIKTNARNLLCAISKTPPEAIEYISNMPDLDLRQ